MLRAVRLKQRAVPVAHDQAAIGRVLPLDGAAGQGCLRYRDRGRTCQSCGATIGPVVGARVLVLPGAVSCNLLIEALDPPLLRPRRFR